MAKNMFLEAMNIGGEFDETGKLKRELQAVQEEPDMGAGSGIFESFTRAPEPEPEAEGFSMSDIPREAIIGGVPMLVGALMGDTGTGATTGGKAIMSDMDRQWQREKLAHSMAKKDRISSGRRRMVKAIDPDTGKSVWKAEEDAEGELVGGTYGDVSEQLRRQETLGKAKDARTLGVSEEKHKMTGEIGDTFEGNPITKVMRSEAKDLESKFQKANSEELDALKQVDVARNLLVSGTAKQNDASVVLAMRIIAKMANKGALSERDAGVAREQLSFVNSAKERAHMERTGRISPRMANNIESALNIISKASSKVVNSSAKKMTSARSSDPNKQRFYMNRISGNIPDVARFPIVVTKGDQSFEVDNEQELNEAKQEGFRAK